MSVEVKLKRATIEDISPIVELLRSNGLPYEDISSKIDYLFVGYAGPRIVGIGGVETYGKYGLLRSLVIEKSLRGKGYGTTFCNKLIEHAKLKGVSEIYILTTTADNFFEKVGFERIERNIAPAIIQETSEFKDLCPVSAVCMRMKLH